MGIDSSGDFTVSISDLTPGGQVRVNLNEGAFSAVTPAAPVTFCVDG